MTPLIESSNVNYCVNDLNESDLQDLIRQAYRQVVGNIHVMDYERLSSAESLLRDKALTVREFVTALGESELYKKLFYYPNNPYRFIELNYKHFLGRAPRDQSEITEHVTILANEGYEAEIKSYTNSYEYLEQFGEDKLPYERSESTTIYKTKDFVRNINQTRGYAGSDRGVKTAAIRMVACDVNSLSKKPRYSGNGMGNTAKRFLIEIDLPGNNKTSRQVSQTVRVPYSQLSQQLRNIQARGGKVRNIKPAPYALN